MALMDSFRKKGANIMIRDIVKHMLPDKIYLKLKYKHVFGRKLDLRNPQTYNEKLQWMKLYDRKDLYTKLVDKYEVKGYVSKLIGDDYIIPTLGVWNSFDEIDFDTLPNQFVLKCTHDSGGLVIVKDKSCMDKRKTKEIIEKCLKNNFYLYDREWPYKNVKPRIIAEKYMEDDTTHDLRDYKIFTFNGEAKILFIATERQTQNEETKFDFFDVNFNHLDIRNGHPNAAVPPSKPEHLDLMVKLAEILSTGIPTLRCDFYEVNGRVYFGELTFFHWGGFVPFDPDEWDYKLGSWIDLGIYSVK